MSGDLIGHIPWRAYIVVSDACLVVSSCRIWRRHSFVLWKSAVKLFFFSQLCQTVSGGPRRQRYLVVSDDCWSCLVVFREDNLIYFLSHRWFRYTSQSLVEETRVVRQGGTMTKKGLCVWLSRVVSWLTEPWIGRSSRGCTWRPTGGALVWRWWLVRRWWLGQGKV